MSRARRAWHAAQASGDPRVIAKVRARMALYGISAEQVGRDPALPASSGDRAPADPARGLVAAAGALAEEYRRGHTVVDQFTDGQNSDLVQRLRLSDGTEVVYKRVDLDASENPDEVTDSYLAGLVAGALGIEGTATAIVGENEVISVFVPGVTGLEQRTTAGDMDGGAIVRSTELHRLLQLRNGREIGLLDCLVGNLDRNDRNFLVDGDTVHPIDHSFAYFHDASDDGPTQIELHSPFSQQHLHARHEVHDSNPVPPPVPVAELVCPFSTAELAEFRSRLQALRPEFEAHQAIGKWEFMMDRLSLIENVSRGTDVTPGHSPQQGLADMGLAPQVAQRLIRVSGLTGPGGVDISEFTDPDTGRRINVGNDGKTYRIYKDARGVEQVEPIPAAAALSALSGPTAIAEDKTTRTVRRTASGTEQRSAGTLLDDQVYEAARGMRSDSGYVSLSEIRAAFQDVPRHELDDALRRMDRRPGVTMMPEANRKALTVQDHADAVRIGNEDNHLLHIDLD